MPCLVATAIVHSPADGREYGAFKTFEEGILSHSKTAQGHIIVFTTVDHAQSGTVCAFCRGVIANRNNTALIRGESKRQVYGVKFKHRCIITDNAHVCGSQFQSARTGIGDGHVLIVCGSIGESSAKVDAFRSVNKNRSCGYFFQQEVIDSKSVDVGRRYILIEGQVDGLSIVGIQV